MVTFIILCCVTLKKTESSLQQLLHKQIPYLSMQLLLICSTSVQYGTNVNIFDKFMDRMLGMKPNLGVCCTPHDLSIYPTSVHFKVSPKQDFMKASAMHLTPSNSVLFINII